MQCMLVLHFMISAMCVCVCLHIIKEKNWDHTDSLRLSGPEVIDGWMKPASSDLLSAA